MNLKNSSLLLTAFTLLLFFCYDHFLMGKVALLAYAALGAAIGLIVVILQPHIVTYFYVLSMFFGITIFVRGSLSVDVADLLFPLFICVNLPVQRSALVSSYKKIIVSLLVFVFLMCLPIPINFFAYPLINSISMPWYVYRAIQLPAVIFFLYHFLHANPGRVTNVISLLLLFSLVQIPLVFYQGMFNHTGDVLRSGIHGTFLYHHSLIAMVFFALLPLFIAVAIESKIFKHKLMGMILTLFSFYIIVVSGSRSVLLGLLCGGGLYVLSNVRWNKQSLMVLISIPLLGLFLYFFTPLKEIFQHTFQAKGTGGIDVSSLSRLVIWQETIKNFLKGTVIDKVIGIGGGLYRTLKYELVIWGGSKSASGAHNNYLHLIIEVGVIGLILFLVHFSILGKFLFNLGKKDLAAKLFFFSMIGFLISGITQETFWFQQAFGSFWVFYLTVFTVIVVRAELSHKEQN